MSIVKDGSNTVETGKVVRKVPGAELVYKKQQDTGKFTELWLFKNTHIKNDIAIRNKILAGTDIKPGQDQSEDGEQSLTVYSCGDITLMSIEGLPQ